MPKYDNVTDLNDLIADAAQRAQRPRMVPREVAAQALQNCLGGVGVGCAVWATMAYFGVGSGMETGLCVGMVFAGVTMGVRAIADEAVDMHRLRKIQKAADVAHKRLQLAIVELNNLEGQNDQLQRDLDTERIIRAQLQEQIQRGRKSNYTAARAEPEPENVRDAREILRRWYESGAYLSRPKANELGWSDDRHAAAMSLLRDAGIAYVNGKQVKITPAGSDEATRKLSDHLIRIKAQAEPLAREEYTDDDAQ